MIRTITQTQIQAFDRCRRYFYLRYNAGLVWPGANEQRAEVSRGDTFHLLVRQLILGLPRDSLLFPADDGTLERWVDAFCREKPLEGYERVFAEKEVSALYADVLWLGKLDAVALNGDRVTVFDWKTGGKDPDAAKFVSSPQTRLYRMLAKACAPRLLGRAEMSYPAENVEMIYWFPEHPEAPIRLPYSETAWQEDLTWLKTLAAEMGLQDELDHPGTDRERRCPYCVYYSYCFPEETALKREPLPVPESADPGDDSFQGELFFPEDPPEQDAVSY